MHAKLLMKLCLAYPLLMSLNYSEGGVPTVRVPRSERSSPGSEKHTALDSQ